jgi:hypothetical protein
MKKSIMFLLCLAYLQVTSLCASSFAIKVPEKFLTQKASLVIYMVDELGNQFAGKCQLDQDSGSRKIAQSELEITSYADIDHLPNVIDLMISSGQVDQGVILNFEFDRSMAVFRILVIKDTLLEENPFDIISFPVGQHSSVDDADEFDEFSNLVDNVDMTMVETSMKKSKNSRSLFQQYITYAEIFALVQYGKAKRAASNVASWLASSGN